MMKVKTPNNTNIQSYLKPDTIYEAEIVLGDCIEFKNHTLLCEDGNPSIGFSSIKNSSHLNGQDWILIQQTNREKLRDFITANNIRTNAVSRALGYKKNWLSQHIGRKDRKDMSDETLNNILKKLHIDWASDQWLTVKAEVPYRTKPCNYPEGHHRERLQRAFWDGLVK